MVSVIEEYYLNLIGTDLGCEIEAKIDSIFFHCPFLGGFNPLLSKRLMNTARFHIRQRGAPCPHQMVDYVGNTAAWKAVHAENTRAILNAAAFSAGL